MRPEPPRRIASLLAASAFLGVLAAALPHGAEAGDPPKGKKPAAGGGPRVAAVADVSMRASAPLSKDLSLVLALPEHYWYWKNAGFDGRGFAATLSPNPEHAGYMSAVYAGGVTLEPANPGEKPADRVMRSAKAFLSRLATNYEKYQMLVVSDAAKIELKATKVKGIEGIAVRSSLFNTNGKASPNSVEANPFMSEFVLLNPAGTDALAYVLVDGKKSGTSLDKMLECVSVQPTAAVRKAASTVKVSVLYQWIAHYVTYDLPAGFGPPETAGAALDLLNESERHGADGTLAVSCRLCWRGFEKGGALLDEAAFEVANVSSPGTPRTVALGTKGEQAVVYDYASTVDGRDCAESTAVFVVEQIVFVLTWRVFGDEAAVKSGREAFAALLGRLQVASRGK